MGKPLWQAKSDLGSLTGGLDTASRHTVPQGLPSGRAKGAQLLPSMPAS